MALLQGREIKMDDPSTWPQSGVSGPTVATIAIDHAEIAALSALGDFHCDDEFEVGRWPCDPDALQRVRDKLAPFDSIHHRRGTPTMSLPPDGSAAAPVANHDETAAAAHPILFAFRELVIAAEQAGWDIGDNKAALDQARAAYADLKANGYTP